MRPKQLSQFLAVCRHGSMSAAAQELGIAQPALSKRIAQLEHELQTDLFERHSRGVTLTRSGETLRREAAELIRAIESIKRSLHHADDDVTGSVRLAVITSLASALAVELYPRIERSHPNIALQIMDYPSARAGDALLRREADLAVIPNAATDLPQAVSTPLFEETFHFIHRAPPAARTSPISLAEAAAQPLALPFHAHDLRRRIEEAARSIGVALNVKYETGSINVIGRLVEEGIACSIVPTTFWLDQIGAGKIAARPVVDPSISRVHSLCWLQGATPPPAVEVVRDVVSVEIRAMVSGGKLSGSLIGG